MIAIETYAQIYPLALGAAFCIFFIAGYTLLREKDDLHHLFVLMKVLERAGVS